MIKLGVIGFGGRMHGLCEAYIKTKRLSQPVTVAAVADPNVAEKAPLVQALFPEARLFHSAEEMLADMAGGLDGLMIGTRCNLHAPLACQAAQAGLPIYLEKPVGITLAQLQRLKQTFDQARVPVVVSFPLRLTLIARRIREIIASGTLGTVEHVQYLNNVPYGDVYFYEWYRSFETTGGLFLQKATHDYDLICYFMNEYPSQVAAMTAQRVYGGEKPYELRCRDCGERETCPESPENLYLERFDHGQIPEMDRSCVFARGLGNEDNGSALLEFPSGRQAVYSQNFFIKKAAGRRGAIIMGARGTIDFDFYRAGEEIRLFLHHTPRVETIGFTSGNMPHWGGDLYLMKNFLEIIEGKTESLSPLRAGIMSAYLGLKSRQSAETRQFVAVDESELDFPPAD